MDQRIETDPERFWDHFQAKTLPAIYDYEMALGKGKPRPKTRRSSESCGSISRMSEPSYRLASTTS